MEEEPVRKPRLTRGTPAYKYSFKLSTYIVGGCFAVHMMLMYFYQDRLYRKIASGYFDVSKFIKDKRRTMSKFSPTPNVHDRPVREWEERTSSVKSDAESTLDADL